MAQLAIKGHEIRGEEVIELLKMLGGKNYSNHSGIRTALYFIHNNTGEILVDFDCYDSNYTVFTLEEFLTKYPFKVGDKVLIPWYESEVRICEMQWDSLCNYVEYMVYRNDDQEWYCAEELLKYNNNFLDNKEEPMKTDVNDNKTLLNMSAIDYNNGLVGYEIPAGYKFDTVIDNKVILKKSKPLFPKTYEECCDILTCCRHAKLQVSVMFPYDAKTIPLLENIRKLLICRDAYWKIAGEEMELGKPWKPYWTIYEHKFCLGTDKDKVIEECVTSGNRILAFPTAEMRDAFYENFKELIEKCKELL